MCLTVGIQYCWFFLCCINLQQNSMHGYSADSPTALHWTYSWIELYRIIVIDPSPVQHYGADAATVQPWVKEETFPYFEECSLSATHFTECTPHCHGYIKAGKLNRIELLQYVYQDFGASSSWFLLWNQVWETRHKEKHKFPLTSIVFYTSNSPNGKRRI